MSIVDEHPRIQSGPVLSEPELDLALRFEDRLQAVKPYLFHLAGQLVDKQPWDVMIVNDTSARLPARFVRQVILAEQQELPVIYVQAGRVARRKVSPKLYTNYLEHELEQLPETPSRALLFDDASGTFSTMRYFEGLIQPLVETTELAVVASSDAAQRRADNLVAGGVGASALSAVHEAFELAGQPRISSQLNLINRIGRRVAKIPRFKSTVTKLLPELKNPSTHPMHNLSVINDGSRPVASRTTDTTYRSLAHRNYRRMSSLAGEFHQQQ